MRKQSFRRERERERLIHRGQLAGHIEREKEEQEQSQLLAFYYMVEDQTYLRWPRLMLSFRLFSLIVVGPLLIPADSFTTTLSSPCVSFISNVIWCDHRLAFQYNQRDLTSISKDIRLKSTFISMPEELIHQTEETESSGAAASLYFNRFMNS